MDQQPSADTRQKQAAAPEPLTWEEGSRKNFDKILEQIPAMIRGIAETRVSKKAERLVREDNRSRIGEKDMVDAFFAETPEGFKGAMRQSMQELGIDYMHYGHQ